jgi:hypothetical protein
MKQIDFDSFLADLSALSEEQFIDPGNFSWPASLETDAWYFTPELISIYGTETWEALDDRQRKRLGLAEAVNFFSLNIHGEKYLISEISKRLYDEDSALLRYLLHFVDEEARHMMYFSGFCHRYAGKIYRDRTVHGEPSGDAELDMFLLFARINVFEEIVDHYNRTMANDERVAPVAREINRIHHVEETRHLNFGRRFLRRCLDQHIEDWGPDKREALRASLSDYLAVAWKQYYNPDAYADAGIDDAFEVWKGAGKSIQAVEHRAGINQRRLSFLHKLELLEAA